MKRFLAEKRLFLLVAAVLLLAYTAYFFGSGFVRRLDMASGSDSVSETNGTITFHAAAMSSMGFPRACKAEYSGDGAYLTFYSAFGGSNGKLGATFDFTVDVPAGCTAVYFPRNGDIFQKAFEKDPETGLWMNSMSKNIHVPAP